MHLGNARHFPPTPTPAGSFARTLAIIGEGNIASAMSHARSIIIAITSHQQYQ